ncbi:MAG: hypothetical protein ABIR83_01295 [Nakamurella sp.]
MSSPDPRAERTPVDPFEAIDADVLALNGLDPVDQVAVFGRIHAALTAALAATAGSTPAGSTPSGSAAAGRPHGSGR